MDKQDENEKKQSDRGAKDDWEALKMVLEDSPALKQRVMHKMREMKDRKKGGGKLDTSDKKPDQDKKA